MVFIYILFTIILILSFIFFKRHLDTNLWTTLICSVFIILILFNPSLCINSTLLGAKLFFFKVFPSLFPFLVISGLIVSCNGIQIYSKIFGLFLCKPLKLPSQCSLALIISILCGYPMGAKYCCELYEKKYINLETCERLLNIATNASPLFVIGAVGTAMLSNPAIGYIILLSNCLSCVVMSYLLPAKKYKNTLKETENYPSTNFGSILKQNIDNSIITTLSIGGFIVLFSVINSFIKSNAIFDIALTKLSIFLNISKDVIQGFFLGLIEMTNGCNIISSTSIAMCYKIAIISFLISFSGISIITQVYSFTYKYNLSMKKYTFRKLIQGFISSILSLCIYFVVNLKPSTVVFNYSSFRITSSLILLSLLLLLFPLSIYAIKALFNVS